MARPHKKKMGRPLEDVPLRKLMRSIRQDIADKLEKNEPEQPPQARKPKHGK
jgi:hypothetical protein